MFCCHRSRLWKKHQVPIKEVLSCLQFLQKVHVVHDSISKAFQSRHLSIQWFAHRFVQFAAADAACSIEKCGSSAFSFPPYWRGLLWICELIRSNDETYFMVGDFKHSLHHLPKHASMSNASIGYVPRLQMYLPFSSPAPEFNARCTTVVFGNGSVSKSLIVGLSIWGWPQQ